MDAENEEDGAAELLAKVEKLLAAIAITPTERGFMRGEFVDRYGATCSIQESSLATEDALWLGVNDADPKVLVHGEGWQPVAVPEGTMFTTRMHLTKAMAAELIPLLQLFVETGYLRTPDEDTVKRGPQNG